MGKEKFDVRAAMESLQDNLNEEDSFFGMYWNEKKQQIDLSFAIDDDDMSAMLAAIIDEGLRKNGRKGMKRLADVIVKALQLLIMEGTPSASTFSSRMLRASSVALSEKLKAIADEDINDDDDCSDCEMLKTCNEEAAIKYRKAHGIPKPNKGSKSRKIKVE